MQKETGLGPSLFVYRKSLAEFAARRRQSKFGPFFAAACTSQKTLLSMQVWNWFAFSEQILRAADCKPLVQKGRPEAGAAFSDQPASFLTCKSSGMKTSSRSFDFYGR